MGRAYRVGGKVVKNSAGFDLSKFLVGSLGQFAIMTELTFKVFPDVACFRSMSFIYQQLDQALAAIAFINQSVFELDALDLLPSRAPGRCWRAWAARNRLCRNASRASRRRCSGRPRRKTHASWMTNAALWNPLAGLGRRSRG